MANVKVDFGVVTALPKEFAAMRAMLESTKPITIDGDPNDYVVGTVPAADGSGNHVIVVTLLKKMGNNSAAAAASHLLRSFRSVNDVLMVGIAGGIPRPSKPDVHVRVGDVLVSNEYGVIQYDNIKLAQGISEIRSTSQPPSATLLGRTKFLEANRIAGEYPWEKHIERAGHLEFGSRPDGSFDETFSWNEKTTPHPADPQRREGYPKIHYGRIGSANILLKDAKVRDTLQEKCDIIGIEMEGSGIADGTWTSGKSYILIRGVCDYCDPNKNDIWQGYAAVVAAAYARALLESFPARRRKRSIGTIKPTISPEKSKIDYSHLSSALRNYLEAVLAYTNRIDIKGIRSQSGTSREAIYFSIEDLYTQLKTSIDYIDKRHQPTSDEMDADPDEFDVNGDKYLEFKQGQISAHHSELSFPPDAGPGISLDYIDDSDIDDEEWLEKLLDYDSDIDEDYFSEEEEDYDDEVDLENNYFELLEKIKTVKHTSEASEAIERMPLTQAVLSHQHLLVVGEPGGGKTTLLRYLAYIFSSDIINWGTSGYISKRVLHLGLTPESSIPIPIFIRLASIANSMERDGVGADGFMEYKKYVLREIESSFNSNTAIDLNTELNNGNCIILLDGLDEVTEFKSRNRVVNILESIIRQWGENLLVVTSRHFDYQAVSGLEGFETVYIDSFGKAEIKEFIDNWVKQLYPESEKRTRDPYQKELEIAIISEPSIRKIAKNPVMLTCLCVVHWNERKLPEAKADLIAAVLRWLISSREQQRKDRGFTNNFAIECFKSLSLAMTSHPEGKKVIVDISWAAEQLSKPFNDELNITDELRIRRDGIRFLEHEMVDSGIIEQAGIGQLKFWHLTFQEHYTAQALADTNDEAWWNSIKGHLSNPQWSEVLDHFAGCLAWYGRYRITLLVERILSTADEDNLMSIASCVGVIGRIIKILEAYEYQPPGRLGWEQKREKALSIFDPQFSKSVSQRVRISAAIALGQSTDPRIQLPISELLTVPEWKTVKLGRFLVTVKEFELFVENDGYTDPFFWGKYWHIKKAFGWESPDNWDEQLEVPTAPVVFISWFEAVAYSNWLSQNCNTELRLPYWGEWEMAAYNPNGPFPWGDQAPNTDLLNYGDFVGNPTPVGVYPSGASRGGHLDLYGNVWEWCLDNESDLKYMEIRGGDYSLSLGSGERKISARVIPIFRDSKIGFRIAQSIRE